MAVSEQPKTYRTCDGREFDNELDAQRHDALAEAQEDYQRARRVWGVRIAETQKTADGYTFKFGVFHDYWWVGWLAYGGPVLRVVETGNREVAMRDYRTAEVEILPYGRKDQDQQSYPVSELYARKENAERAYVLLREEYLADETAKTAEMRARVFPDGGEAGGGS